MLKKKTKYKTKEKKNTKQKNMKNLLYTKLNDIKKNTMGPFMNDVVL